MKFSNSEFLLTFFMVDLYATNIYNTVMKFSDYLIIDFILHFTVYYFFLDDFSINNFCLYYHSFLL